MTEGKQVVNCAIYTRKSSEEGLEQEFNSLDAQYDVCAQYIQRKENEGWRIVPERYDDGGFSGGNAERPALKRMLADCEAGYIDVIVVYKIDRLSRSMLDFSKMIEKLENQNISFVSVTQDFSTKGASGRMVTNITMAFAQYEREMASERIRDKIALSKKRGKYCGESPILGYDVNPERTKLVVNEAEALTVQYIFRRFLEIGSVKQVAKELNQQGYRTKAWQTKKGKPKGGVTWNTSHLYRLINNRTYIGQVTHKEKFYEGEHKAIIEKDDWEKAQEILRSNCRLKSKSPRVTTASPMRGLIRCAHCDSAMGITYTKKMDRRYTYYICEKDAKRPVSTCPIKRIPAGDIEKAVVNQVGAIFRTPRVISQTYKRVKTLETMEENRLRSQLQDIQSQLNNLRTQALEAAKQDSKNVEGYLHFSEKIQGLTEKQRGMEVRLKSIRKNSLTETEIMRTFQTMDVFWENLFPIEQRRLIEQVVKIIEISESGLDMILKTAGIEGLVNDLAGIACELNERSHEDDE